MELFFIFNEMNPGTPLVATPSVMGDGNFHRAVVLLVNHGDSGSIGFILNKKIEYTLDEVLEGVLSKQPLYFGGPVEPDNLFYIHTLGSQISKSIPITDSLYWNGDFEEVVQLLEAGKLNEENIRFFLGYSGWSEGQLEAELEEKSWEPFIEKTPLELIKMPIDRMWQECMIALGGTYLLWSNAPDNPRFN